MWLFELMGLVVMVGVVVGLVWRFGEDWLERRNAEKQLRLENEDTTPVSEDVLVENIASTVSTTKTN